MDFHILDELLTRLPFLLDWIRNNNLRISEKSLRKAEEAWEQHKLTTTQGSDHLPDGQQVSVNEII